MYEQIAQNKRNSVFLIVFFTALVVVLGYLIGEAMGWGYGALILAFILAAAMALFGYFGGDKMVLAVSRAQPASRERHAQLYNITEELTIASGLPMPRLYIIPDDNAPNAFAAGRNPRHASVAVTTALLDRLNRQELQGVIAHELSHVGNYDILFATLVGILVGTVVILADFFLRSLIWGGGRRRGRSASSSGKGGAILMLIAVVLAILAPIFAKLIQLATSRQREYLADASAAKMTRYPEGLASALEKIAVSPAKLESANRGTAHFYIVNPLKVGGRKRSQLWSTHPDVAERVKRLRALASSA